jgi:hypothetical protein
MAYRPSIAAPLRFLGRVALFLWLTGVVLVHFVAPLYLLAIYPRVPDTGVTRYGLSLASPAIQNFWFRLFICGLFVMLGLLIVRATLRSIRKK